MSTRNWCCFDPRSKFYPVMRGQGSNFPQIGNFSDLRVSISITLSYRKETFTIVFQVQFWVEWDIVLASWSNICDVQTRKETTSPSPWKSWRWGWGLYIYRDGEGYISISKMELKPVHFPVKCHQFRPPCPTVSEHQHQSSKMGIFFLILTASQSPVGGTLRNWKGTLCDLERAPWVWYRLQVSRPFLLD